MRTVHFLTIGQSPRPDVVPEILGMLGDAAADIEAVEAGALDGLSRDEVRAGAPRDGEMPLVSRLRSGEEVIIGEDFVEATDGGAPDPDPDRMTWPRSSVRDPSSGSPSGRDS